MKRMARLSFSVPAGLHPQLVARLPPHHHHLLCGSHACSSRCREAHEGWDLARSSLPSKGNKNPPEEQHERRISNMDRQAPHAFLKVSMCAGQQSERHGVQATGCLQRAQHRLRPADCQRGRLDDQHVRFGPRMPSLQTTSLYVSFKEGINRILTECPSV